MEPAKTNLPAILVVDDEMDISLAISDLLRNAGYRVETAGTGTEALNRVSPTHPYSAVILDLGLPDIDGLKVLQQLQVKDQTLPVIILTAHGDQKEKIATLQHQAFAHLIKPYDRQEVIEMVHRAIAVKHLALKAAQAEQALTSSEARRQLEQQRTQTLLSESEQRLTLALKAGNMGIWDWHVPTNYIIWSEEVAGLFGFAPGTFDGTYRTYANCIHPEDRAMLEDTIRNTLEKGAPYEVEHRIVWPSGEIRWLACKGQVIKDQEGRPLRMIGTVQDISTRKQAEIKLRDSEMFLTSIVENIPHMIFVKDAANLCFLRFNQAGEKLLGYSRETLLGKTDFDFFPKSEAEFYTRKDREVLSGKTPMDIPEEIIHTNTYGMRYLHTKKIPILDEQGNARYLLGISEDVTERKQGELDLVERNRMLELDIAVTTVINQQEEIPGLLQGCTEALVRHLDAAFARIWRLDEGQQELRLCASSGMYTHLDGPHSRVPVGKYKIGLIAAERKPILTNAVIGDSLVPEQEWAKREGMVAFAGYPLLRNQEVLGVMALFAKHPLTDFTLKSLAMVADRITVALERQMTKNEKLKLTVFKQRLLASAGEGIFGLDRKGKTTFVNPAVLQMTGYEEDELLGQAQHAMLHHTKLGGLPYPQAECPIYAALRDGSVHHVDTEVFWRKDGTNFPVQYTSTPIQNDSGEVEGAVVTFRDITDRKQAEKQLQESEERFRLLNEAIPQQVWTANPDGSLDFVNQRILEYFGCSAEEMIGHGWQQFLHPDDLPSCLERWAEARAINQPYEIEFRLRRGKDQTYRWHLGRALPMFDQTGQVIKWFGTNTDITQFKQLENQVRQSQKMEAMGTLAGGIAHDFNNILMAIIGYTELAKRNARENDEVQRNLEEVLLAGQRAKELVKQILTFSRQTEQERQPVDIQLVVKEACKFLRATLPATIKIDQHFTEAATIVLGDPIQMHQVVMNLCANSEYAMRETGGTLDLRVEIFIGEPNGIGAQVDQKKGPYVRLTVRDTGAGMTPDVAQRIFDPFFTTKRIGEGTGMGLAVVHGIVIGHGGVIHVESEPGQGTTFHIYLPKMETESVQEEDNPFQQDIFMGREQILFVEDEEPLAKLGEEILKGIGYEVMVCTSSVQALKVFQADPFRFDAVVTDQTMPEITGEALARKLLQLRPELPIVLCTGFSHSMTPEKAKALGIRAFLLKPLLIKDLARILREVFYSS